MDFEMFTENLLSDTSPRPNFDEKVSSAVITEEL